MNHSRLLFLISISLLLCLSACVSGRSIKSTYREAFFYSQQRLAAQEAHCPGPLALLSEQGERKESMILYTECDKETIRVLAISPLGFVHASIVMRRDVLVEERLEEAFKGFGAEDILLLVFNHCCMEVDVQGTLKTLSNPCRIRLERESRSLTLLPDDTSKVCQ